MRPESEPKKKSTGKLTCEDDILKFDEARDRTHASKTAEDSDEPSEQKESKHLDLDLDLLDELKEMKMERRWRRAYEKGAFFWELARAAHRELHNQMRNNLWEVKNQSKNEEEFKKMYAGLDEWIKGVWKILKEVLGSVRSCECEERLLEEIEVQLKRLNDQEGTILSY